MQIRLISRLGYGPAGYRSATRPGSAALLLATAAAGGCLIGCGKNQPQVDDLQFQKNGAILAAKTVAAGQSYGWGPNDLASVPDTPLPAKAPPSGGSFNLWYQTPVATTEVDLFALDPTGLAVAMTNMIPFVEFATGNDQFWVQLVQTTASNPPAAAFPFPGPGIALNMPFPPLTATLSTSLFLDPNFQPLLGDAALPSGTGSVKAARIYDHGSCSASQALLPVYAQIQTQFDNYFACSFNSLGATPQRTYSHLATQLKNHENDPSNFSDGFVFDAYYGAGVPVFSNLKIFFNESYYFYVSDGLIGVQPGNPALNVTGHDSDQVTGTLKGFLTVGAPENSDISLPKQLADSIERTQTSDPFKTSGLGSIGCNKTDGITDTVSTGLHHAYQSECKAAINVFSALIDQAGPKLQLSPQDRQALKNALAAKWPYDDGKGPYWSYWRCVPQPQPATPANACQFTIPVKRINVYPDALEAVFFDGNEVNNAAFAAFVAFEALPNPKGNPPPFCSFKQVQPGPALSYRRPFALNSEGAAIGLGGFGVVCP